MKPLSEMLEEIEPQLHDCCDQTGRHILTAADYNDYQRLKRVAIELAKGHERISKDFVVSDDIDMKKVRAVGRVWNAMQECIVDAQRTITRAKDIIGGE